MYQACVVAALKEGIMAHIVNTGSGWIRGMRQEDVLAFRGIPYA